jgi:transcriptional antiterminator RfaH
MPVLPLEPFIFPADLLERECTPTGTDATAGWWVLHTRPRTEKKLARMLIQKQIPYFLPLYQRERLQRGRLVHSYLPLFPGYVFLRGDENARLQALQTNTVAQSLDVKHQDQLHHDLARVYRLMATGAPLTPLDRLQPGAWVEITSGPFAGMEGKVIRRGRRLRFVIEVQFLQRGAAVEIDRWMLEPR